MKKAAATKKMKGEAMKLWVPDRRQWFVIWTVYAVVVLAVMDLSVMEAGYPPIEGDTFIGLVVVAGALVVWQMQGKRQG